MENIYDKQEGIIIFYGRSLGGKYFIRLWQKEVADDSFVATPKPEKTEETVIESDETDNETITGTIAIKANMPYVFSEGYAWVRTDTSDQLAVVDTDGNIKFTLDNVSEGIKVSNNDAANGITYDLWKLHLSMMVPLP